MIAQGLQKKDVSNINIKKEFSFFFFFFMLDLKDLIKKNFFFSGFTFMHINLFLKSIAILDISL